MRKVTGGGAPAEIWRNFMVAALPRLQAQPIPGGTAPPPDENDPLARLLTTGQPTPDAESPTGMDPPEPAQPRIQAPPPLRTPLLEQPPGESPPDEDQPAQPQQQPPY
jgi:penicillin-binding protein 1A